MAKKREISVEELLAYQKAGAKITQTERKMIVAHIEPVEHSTTTINQFSDLLERLDSIIAASKAGAEKMDVLAADNSSRSDRDRQMADAHFKLFSELHTALLGLAKRIDRPAPVPVQPKPSLEPLKTVLNEMKRLTRPVERASYEFEVVRSQQGFIDKIIATPVAATKH